MTKIVEAWIDGAARGNPGKSGVGVRIKRKNGKVLKEEFEYLGDEYTNNQAEYSALLKALKVCDEIGARKIDVYSDSSLIVNQMEGKFRVRSDNLEPLYKKAKKLASNFAAVSYNHVSRKENSEADRLANKAIDEES